jgi:N-acetylneuraminic acid mutarotase
MPARGGVAVWDGHELLVLGAGRNARVTLAFDPAANRWRRLASPPISAAAASAVWTGRRVLLWANSRGFAYDPATNTWSALPQWPLRARDGSDIAWTGGSLIVWGGEIGTPLGTSIPPRFPLDGASFTPEVK